MRIKLRDSYFVARRYGLMWKVVETFCEEKSCSICPRIGSIVAIDADPIATPIGDLFLFPLERIAATIEENQP